MIETLIPPDRWHGFCQSFSRRHAGWLVTVRCVQIGSRDSEPPQPGQQTRCVAENGPLQGIRVKDNQGKQTITMVVGGAEGPTLHAVTDPLSIQLEQTDQGADRRLTVRSASGQISVLEFMTPHFVPGEDADTHRQHRPAVGRPRNHGLTDRRGEVSPIR